MSCFAGQVHQRQSQSMRDVCIAAYWLSMPSILAGPTSPATSLVLYMYQSKTRAVVLYVALQSSAAASGLRVGDEVVAVDGRPVASLLSEGRGSRPGGG